MQASTRIAINFPSVVALAVAIILIGVTPNHFFTENDAARALADAMLQVFPFSTIPNKSDVSSIPDAITVTYIAMWSIAPFWWAHAVIFLRGAGLESIFPRENARGLRPGSLPWRALVLIAAFANFNLITWSDGQLSGCPGCLSDSRVASGLLIWLFFWTQGFLLSLLFTTFNKNTATN